jgi:Tfp pilus assembly protein PilX
MQDIKSGKPGFALVASLLLLLLLSGLALGLMMMVNTEQRVGGFDLNNNYAYHSAEGAIEKMTSDLANLFKTTQAPTSGQICSLSNNPPTGDPTITYTTYNILPMATAFSADPCSASSVQTTPYPTSVWGPIQAGADAGLYAQIIPITMNVVAQRTTGETVSMTRTTEIALIPVFQFGMFSDADLAFFSGSNFGFGGRIHTNGDLYLGAEAGHNLVFNDKISAFGNLIRAEAPNEISMAALLGKAGPVLIPTQAGGCATQVITPMSALANGTCVDIASTELGATAGSVLGGHGSAQNTTSWINVSTGTYQGYLTDGNGQSDGFNGPNSTGATKLTLSFVNGTTNAVQIIRLPPLSENTTSILGQNREANMAQIRILLADNETQLHLTDWNGDSTQDYQLVSMLPAALAKLSQGSGGGTQPAGGIKVGANTYYFGESYCTGTAVIGVSYPAALACPTANGGDGNQIIPQYYGPQSNGPGGSAMTPHTFPGPSSFTTANNSTNGLEWPLINGWLLVEVKEGDGAWHGVTKEWLQLGFARGLQVPTQPGTPYVAPSSNAMGVYGSNSIKDHKDAILYFQQTADRNGDNAITASDLPVTANLYGAGSQYNWYPINLYDAREGENYDTIQPTKNISLGTPNGIMNLVELDVGNLRNWLLGKTGKSGPNVDFESENGYVLYFSDRRGMQFATSLQGLNYQSYWGEYGFEDTINLANIANQEAPDGVLDPVNYNGISAEDVNGNTYLDNYGVKYVGDAFGPTTTADTDTTSPPSPYAIGHRINTFTYGRANRVTGARHALKLVDGSLGNLPTMPAGNAINNCAFVNPTTNVAQPTGCGGFTVASENPVYVQGNYNSNCFTAGDYSCTPGNTNYDLTWGNPPGAEPNHAAAAIIADAVTILSSNWQDTGCEPLGGACTDVLTPTTGSLLNPAYYENRTGSATYVRAAIAAGKSIAFNNVYSAITQSFGTDGGGHNFLRFLEGWGGSLYYKGSLVCLYWSSYATGSYKTQTIYSPPGRQFSFDSLFSQPNNLPPGTPMLRAIDNLTYRQNLVPRTN